jgi:hypothetical protein
MKRNRSPSIERDNLEEVPDVWNCSRILHRGGKVYLYGQFFQ